MILSIVIICKDDASGVERTLKSVADLEADILVYDSGSRDGSQQAALKNHARLHEGAWEGYGRIRFKAAQLAKYDWILMLHTNEVIDDELKESLRHLDFTKHKQVYRIPFKNYFGHRWLRHGAWGRYSHIRLANRKGVNAAGELVDENIFLQAGLNVKNIHGHIIHHAVRNSDAFAIKVVKDALLSAARHQRKGKKASVINLYVSPLFFFIKNYFFKLGFLDGWEGYYCAKMGARYTFLKYTRLRELNKRARMPV